MFYLFIIMFKSYASIGAEEWFASDDNGGLRIWRLLGASIASIWELDDNQPSEGSGCQCDIARAFLFRRLAGHVCF